jgi:hypothetical protein
VVEETLVELEMQRELLQGFTVVERVVDARSRTDGCASSATVTHTCHA